MKTLFEFEFANDHYLLQSNNWGKEILQRNGQPISVKRNLRYQNEHHFDCPNLGSLRLAFRIDTDAIQTQYSLWAGEQCLLSDSQSALHYLPEFIRKHYQPTADSNAQAADGPAPAADAATQMTASQPGEASRAKPTTNESIGTWITVGGTLLKLSKSAGAMKAALAGTALAGWSWLFSFEFALALIVALLIHEYGHIWAMKRTGLKIKGVFLIPFLGGVAVGEGTTSRWQDFQIAIAGPLAGTLSAVLFWGLWLQTGHDFWALLTSISLLLNLFNLLPIVPLDGGQVIKAAVLSLQLRSARAAMLVLNLAFVALMFWLGFNLLGFFGLLGLIDILLSGRNDERPIPPMSNTGILLTLTSYAALMAVLVLLASLMANTGIAGADLPLVFLRS